MLADAQDFRAQETGLAGEHVDAFRPAVGDGPVGQRVEPAEDPVADLLPVRPCPLGEDAETAGLTDRLGDIRRVDEHLRRDAPAVQAGAAETAGLHHRDPPSGVLVSRQRVPAASTDDHKVVVVRRHLAKCTPPAGRLNRPFYAAGAWVDAVADPGEGVAADGTIRTGAQRDRVPALFEPVLADAITFLDRSRASLYVYGSVANGTARPGSSDVDLLSIDLPLAGLLGQQLSARYSDRCRGVEVAAAAAADLAGDDDATYGFRVFLPHSCVHLAR